MPKYTYKCPGCKHDYMEYLSCKCPEGGGFDIDGDWIPKGWGYTIDGDLVDGRGRKDVLVIETTAYIPTKRRS